MALQTRTTDIYIENDSRSKKHEGCHPKNNMNDRTQVICSSYKQKIIQKHSTNKILNNTNRKTIEII